MDTFFDPTCAQTHIEPKKCLVCVTVSDAQHGCHVWWASLDARTLVALCAQFPHFILVIGRTNTYTKKMQGLRYVRYQCGWNTQH